MSDHDAIVLVHRSHEHWAIEGCKRPLFICGEMFLGLEHIEQRRWQAWQLRRQLAREQQEVATLADFLRAEDVAWLEQCGARVAHEWHADQTPYRGTSLGRCIEYDVKARAIRLLKLWVCVTRAMHAHPNCATLTDYPEDSTEYRVLQAFGRPIRRFGDQPRPTTARTPAAAVHPGRLPGRLKAQVLAKGRVWGLLAMRGLSAVLATGHSSATPTAVVRVGLQSSRMLESWLRGRRPQVRFALWMDYLMRPRTVLSLVLSGASFTPPSSAGARSDEHAVQAALAQPARRVVLVDAPFDIGRTETLHALLSEMLSSVARARFPRAAADIDDAHTALGSPSVSLLVIPNDCQPLMRAWTLVARQLGKRTLVVQHGHLDYTEDEDHHTADFSAFWSEVVAKGYMRAGLRPHQCLVTGSPNADDYPGRPDRSRGTRARPGRRPKVLVITTGNPAVQAYIHETWVCDYIAGVLDGLAPRFGDIDVAIKLHPGEDGALYASNLGALLPSDTVISDRGNLVQMISEADVVISPPSTVVVEARAAGTPVVLVSMMSVDNRQTTLRRADGVTTVDRYEDLAAAVDTILAGAHAHDDAAWPLSDYLGPIDGRSSQRLLDAVCDLTGMPAPSLDADDVRA